MSETKETKVSGKGVIIALGIICIILVAGLAGTIAFYTSMMNDKNSTISSLNTKVSELNSTINSLISSIMNGSTTILSIITNDPSALVNRTVTVEGNLTLAIIVNPCDLFEDAPYSYLLYFGSQAIGVSMSASVKTSVISNIGTFPNYTLVRIYGVVEKGEITWISVSPGGHAKPSFTSVTYYIEAETVEML